MVCVSAVKSSSKVICMSSFSPTLSFQRREGGREEEEEREEGGRRAEAKPDLGFFSFATDLDTLSRPLSSQQSNPGFGWIAIG